MSGNKSIIVKKIKKIEGGHHGGAWKVAYADFVTAMMAFFLLLWLLSMVSDEKRARLSSYFKHFSMFDSGGESWMAKSSEMFDETGVTKQKVFTDDIKSDVPNVEGIEEILNQGITEHLGDVKDQVLVDIVDNGVRIQITDKDGSLMFQKGKKALTPKAIEILKVITEQIRGLPNKLVIEGHTDALQYSGSAYSNWELSTERASSARKALEVFGIDPKRVERVAGYADTDPLIKEDPLDPRNRRISITIKHAKKPAIPTGNYAADDQSLENNKTIKQTSNNDNKLKVNEETGPSLSENFKYKGLPLRYIKNDESKDDIQPTDDNNKADSKGKLSPAISNDYFPLLKDDLDLGKPAREGYVENNGSNQKEAIDNRPSTNSEPRNSTKETGASISGIHNNKKEIVLPDPANLPVPVKARADEEQGNDVPQKQDRVIKNKDTSLSKNLDYKQEGSEKKSGPKEGGAALGEEWNPVISKDDFFSPPAK